MTDVELRLTADLNQATKEVAGFRKEYQEMVKAVEKPLRQVNALRETQESAKSASAAYFEAKRRVEELKAAIAQAGQPVRELDRAYAQAQRTLAVATREFDRQKASVREQREELRKAGVDTKNLAAEQQRLQRELNSAVSGGRSDAAVSGIRARAAALAQVTREQRLANIESARADLGVNRYRALQAELQRVRSQYQLLRTSGKLTAQELAIAQRAMTQRVRETQQAMREMNAEQRRSRAGSGLVSSIGAVGAGYAAVSAITGVARMSDAYNLMNARLKLATSSQEEFNTAQSELRAIAERTEAPVASLVTLYGRISRPLTEAGRSQRDILRLTEAVATSFRVSGATAQEAENGVIQFAQALGAGALRGEEFNSVAEQAPRLMQALADGIGVPVGALKEMAAQGELTAEVVTDALTGQLDTLRKEAETLPETVGGAMTKLADRWNEAIGQADVQPLINAINQLGETLSDPVVVGNLISLASALASLAGTVAEGASEFTDLGKRIAFIAANSTGLVTELDKVDQQIADIDKSLKGTGLSTTLDGLLYSKEELEAKRAALVAFRASIVEEQTGLNEDLRKAAEEASAQAAEAREKDLADYGKYISDLKRLQAQQVEAAGEAIKKQEQAEKKALSDLEKVKAERLKIEERYQEALAGLNSGGDASFGAANALKVGARQALQAGDVQGAQNQAQAALKMLQEIAAAGGNTYGFAGFIQELQEIELAANDIEQSQAQQKIDDIRASMVKLAEDAKRLENMPVSVKSDEASIERVRTEIQALAAQLSDTEVVIPVRLQHPDGPIVKDLPPAPDGFARGGWTGPGSKYQPAGIVHADEHVQPKEVVNEPGALSFLERIRRYGFQNTMRSLQSRFRGYAEGGLVTASRAVPSIPPLAPALQQQLAGPSLPNLGSLTLDIGGQSTTIYADQSAALDLKRLATKLGRTKR